jgi:CheY-like chemotaxis protein
VKALGYAAESAENGVDALDKWKSGRFKMVITDCNMPEMDGFEVATYARNDPIGSLSPISRAVICGSKCCSPSSSAD